MCTIALNNSCDWRTWEKETKSNQRPGSTTFKVWALGVNEKTNWAPSTCFASQKSAREHWVWISFGNLFVKTGDSPSAPLVKMNTRYLRRYKDKKQEERYENRPAVTISPIIYRSSFSMTVRLGRTSGFKDVI